MPLAWPKILVPSSELWALKGGSRSGGQTFSGIEQVVQSPASRWAATLTVPCNNDAKVMAMRSLIASLDGRSGTVTVGPIEVRRAPWFVDPLSGGRVSYGRGAEGAAIDPAYENNPDTSSSLNFRAGQAAPMNAVAMVIERLRGGFLQPGMKFSINGQMYLLVALTTPDPVNSDTQQPAPGMIGVQIRPWLRLDCPATTLIEFGRPICTMRLASDDTGAMELQLSRFGTVTLDLVEAF